jgi:diguanylate cyclase (GGDEF)-like protein
VSSKKKYIHIDELNEYASQSIHNNPEQGISLSREAFKISKPLGYKKGIAESKLTEGWCFLLKNNFEESHKALESSYTNFKLIKDTIGEIKALNAFGVLYSDISSYETAMTYHTQSLELSKKTENDERLASCYINIGSVYFELGKTDKALECYNNSLEVLERTNNQTQLCACLINIGECYENQNNLDIALQNYTKALGISIKTSNKVYESNCLTSMGKVFQKTGKIEEAIGYHEESIKIAESLGDKLTKLDGLTNLAVLYFDEGDINKSVEVYLISIELGKSINSRYYLSKNYLGLSKVYKKQNSFEKSMDFFQKYHDVYIELQNEEIDIKLKGINIQNKIEANQKEAENQRNKNTELEEAFNRVSLLNKIGQDIISSLEMETVMSNIYKHLSTFISADLFGIALYDEILKLIDFKYFMIDDKRSPDNRKPLSAEGSMASWVISHKKHLYLNDVQNEYLNYVPKLLGSKTDKTKSLIFVPLIINTKVIGVITVQSYKMNAYSEQHLEILQAVGAYSAIALENSKVHEEINKLNVIINTEKKELEKAYKKIDNLANHDILTGLPNRRLFVELLKQELRKADRQKMKTAVIFIDLDDFKPVNDTIGHSAGDKVLQMVAQRFMSTLRGSDSIARIGGDEFAAIICNIQNKADVEKIANKIVKNFENPFKVESSQFPIGVSMGISIYPDDDNTIDGLLKKADTAMYKIKTESKNSYYFFKTEV